MVGTGRFVLVPTLVGCVALLSTVRAVRSGAPAIWIGVAPALAITAPQVRVPRAAAGAGLGALAGRGGLSGSLLGFPLIPVGAGPGPVRPLSVGILGLGGLQLVDLGQDLIHEWGGVWGGLGCGNG